MARFWRGLSNCATPTSKVAQFQSPGLHPPTSPCPRRQQGLVAVRWRAEWPPYSASVHWHTEELAIDSDKLRARLPDLERSATTIVTKTRPPVLREPSGWSR